MRAFWVYLLRNSLDGRVFYVGKGGRYRLSQHLAAAKSGSRLPVHEKIREIVNAGGQVLYEAVCETTEEFLAFDEESRLIRTFGRDNLTNQTDGGEGATGAVHPREAVERRAAKLRGRKHPTNIVKNKDPEFRKKVSAGLKRAIAEGRFKIPSTLGRKASEETRARLRSSHLGKRPSNLVDFVKLGHEAHKAKAAERGAWHSEETRRKIGEAQKGRKPSAETRAKYRAAWRPSAKRAAAMAKLLADPEYRAKVSAGVKRWWDQRKARLISTSQPFKNTPNVEPRSRPQSEQACELGLL